MAGRAVGRDPQRRAGPACSDPTVRAFLDTNVLIRHLTGDPPEMAARTTRFLADAESLLLVDLVLAEVVYVLESFYEVQRPRVVEIVRSILAFEAITVVDEELLLRAAEVYEVDRLDFADAYLVACAERTGVGTIASFDRAIDRVLTITRLEPEGA
jgi:predicted nucleic acid-binding protein